ncbi:hypothetical protein M9458_049359, partial [Cirrhinus mrigala]
ALRQLIAWLRKKSHDFLLPQEKQKMLEIASRKFIIDVATRWNSSMDMLERYLEQQAEITRSCEL